MTARASVGTFSHLAARFLDVLTARRLEPAERAYVRTLLDADTEESAFFAQSDADQRHGHDAARAVEAAGGSRPTIRAALLHDIGKRHAHLGPLGRVGASLAMRAGLPLPRRWAMYRDHGVLAAAELAHAEELVVAFARHHHEDRPESIDLSEWHLLVSADGSRWGR